MVRTKEEAMMPRGFEAAKGFKNVKLPERTTERSAGYDFYALRDVMIIPNQTAVISTGVKAFMQPDEVLLIYPRSSLGFKKNLMLSNTVAVIDADYYGNPDNDGHIIIGVRNLGNEVQYIKAGERIAQGIFTKFLSTGDSPTSKRIGGLGSTGR